ncbi:hypothetical protein G9F72_020990 [Clostridium estertheticum]|uniref:hypothetical protein n=1 Tax=Clostridium estertheticum TaxID=238834 RepID=UPI0013E992A7|nr:hypothetical protein [Clostridium estertheticum]MBZ9688800.1 hypothetical protein [Clostridium estertheticum]
MFFKDKKNSSTIPTKHPDKAIVRRATFRILSTVIIYNIEEDYYDTLATCSNENNVIETISIEEFEIHENVIELKGAYIDYEEYKDGLEVNCTGTIYYL